jgi:hypothetical protein
VGQGTRIASRHSNSQDPICLAAAAHRKAYNAFEKVTPKPRSVWIIGIVFLGSSLWFFAGNSLVPPFASYPWILVYASKALIEVVACSFSTFYLLVAFGYREPEIIVPPRDPSINSNTLLAYLCSDDLNVHALENIVHFCSFSAVSLLVHDDSTSTMARNHLDLCVAGLASKYRTEIPVLRRRLRSGGKPGAVNNVVAHLPRGIKYLFLCDSDSFILSWNILDHAAPIMADPRVALVQFRNIGHTYPEDRPGYRILARSIDFYDAFVAFMDRFGWSPFLGHNALIRVSAFHEAGGFTPGQFADDIDFSVKVRLRGHKIRYVRSAMCGERHPISYGALRRRTAKWAYGCTQVLLRWSKAILMSPVLSLSDKITFFLTVGYYHFQALLLIYLTIFYLLLPFDRSNPVAMSSLMTSAGLIMLITFLPSISFFLKAKRIANWPSAAACWGYTYGSQDFVVVAAIFRCLIGGRMSWVPTNVPDAKPVVFSFARELVFSILIVVVAAFMRPSMLALPTSLLFVGKFLITPWLDRWLFQRTSDMAHTT